MANALASLKKKPPRTTTKLRPIDIKGRPGGGYLQWVQVRHPSEPRVLKFQVRWNLFGLPIGVVVAPPNPQYLGRLVVLTTKTSSKLRWSKLPCCTFVFSAYELQRQTGHITTSYATEVVALNKASSIARDANSVALSADPKQVAVYQQTMARLVAAFEAQVGERVRDQDKVQSRHQMATSVSLTDTTGRPNPRAAAARTQAAVSRVTRRTMGATDISTRIRKRRVAADGLISFAEQLVVAPLQSLATTVMSGFEQLTLSPGMCSSLIARCTDVARQCRLIDWRPHVRLAANLAAELDHAIEMLHRRDSGMILAHFTIINEICDLSVAQLLLHDMITEFRNPLLHKPAERIAFLAIQLQSLASFVRGLSSAALSQADRNQILDYFKSASARLRTIRPPVRLRSRLSDKQLEAVVDDLREAGRLF